MGALGSLRLTSSQEELLPYHNDRSNWNQGSSKINHTSVLPKLSGRIHLGSLADASGANLFNASHVGQRWRRHGSVACWLGGMVEFTARSLTEHLFNQSTLKPLREESLKLASNGSYGTSVAGCWYRQLFLHYRRFGYAKTRKPLTQTDGSYTSSAAVFRACLERAK
eukprot:6214311-Pleurochrysis_carterae.AAC.1